MYGGTSGIVKKQKLIEQPSSSSEVPPPLMPTAAQTKRSIRTNKRAAKRKPTPKPTPADADSNTPDKPPSPKRYKVVHRADDAAAELLKPVLPPKPAARASLDLSAATAAHRSSFIAYATRNLLFLPRGYDMILKFTTVRGKNAQQVMHDALMTSRPLWMKCRTSEVNTYTS